MKPVQLAPAAPADSTGPAASALPRRAAGAAWGATFTGRLTAASAAAFAVIFACASPPALAVAPTTFGPVIGNALLCLNQPDMGYFREYLTKAFGAPYKNEQGALWFRANATLWNVPVSEIMMSDGANGLVFIAAVADVEPDKLESAIAAAIGIRHTKLDRSAFPVRESPAGSKIVYFNKKSKIFCAKSEYLRAGRQ